MKIIVCILPDSQFVAYEPAMRLLREHGLTPEVIAVALGQSPTPEERIAELIKELALPRIDESPRTQRSVPYVRPKRKAGKRGNDPHVLRKHMLSERPRNPRFK